MSSDRAVLDAARRARCAAVTADAFLAALGHEAEADARDLDERDEPAAPGARGHPRCPSRAARAADRALRRLRAR